MAATTIITSSQYTPMGSFGYYPQSTPTAFDSITLLKQQFWRQAQQPKQSKFRQRTASPPRKCLDPTKGHLSEDHLAIGMVVFLPPKNTNRENCTCILPNCQHRQLLDKAYNHPALVLGIRDDRQSGGELTALCCIVRHTCFFSHLVQTLILGRSRETQNPSPTNQPANSLLPKYRRASMKLQPRLQTVPLRSTSNRRAA
jgi:hypothetical protein